MQRPRICLLAAATLFTAATLGLPTQEDGVLKPPERLEVEPGLPVTLTSHNDVKLVDVLNARFLAGRPSDTLEEAGVILHQFDGSGFDELGVSRQGGVNESWNAWRPCPAGLWCAKFGDRFSTSLVNARQPYLFSRTNAGLIVDAGTSQRGGMCAWASDARGYRAARTCLAEGERFLFHNVSQTFVHREGCVPGCTNGIEGQMEDNNTVMRGHHSPTWCSSSSDDHWCPWRPQQLRSMMEQQERHLPNNDCGQYNGCQYNEVRASSFTRLPPPHPPTPPALKALTPVSALLSLTSLSSTRRPGKLSSRERCWRYSCSPTTTSQ